MFGGNDGIWRSYFSSGLVQPPTRNDFSVYRWYFSTSLVLKTLFEPCWTSPRFMNFDKTNSLQCLFFRQAKNHAKTHHFWEFCSHLVQITTAGEALQILRLGWGALGFCVRLMQAVGNAYNKLNFPGEIVTRIHLQLVNVLQIWGVLENSAPIYRRQPSGAKNKHQTNVHGGERDEILSPDILSLNESHPFLKSPRLNPGCRNIAVLTYQKIHSRGCLTSWKFMVSLFGCIFYDPAIRTWWCSLAKGMFQKVTTWWNLGKRFLKLPVFRVSCSQRESVYGVYIHIAI